MPILAHDDVVVHQDAKRLGDLDDRLRHLDVGARRRRIAGRMVMHQTTARFITLINQGFAPIEPGEGTAIGGGG